MVVEANTIVRGKYRITRLIGDGGMGAVYEAEHLILKVPVALKFLHADLAERPGLAERFLREARVSASIQSTHVARVTDVDKTDAGTPFLVMELLRGESLQDVLDREQCLGEAVCIDYALQLLSGLEAAHALNVVHRDLKPDNVLITQTQGGPLLKLIDFGIAKLRSSAEFKQTLTRAGAMMGTPEYMAPEQLYSAENVDARADIFSLGVMLYEMLCGTRPVEGDEAVEIVGKFVSGSMVPLQQRLPNVNEALVHVVHRALEPEREKRFESAFSMRMALVPLAGSLSHAGQLATTPAPLQEAPLQEAPLQEAPLLSSGRSAAELNDEPDPSTRRTSVADTLPPAPESTPTTEDEPTFPNRGQTEDAPLANLHAAARAHASAMPPPPSPTAQRAAAAVRIQPAAVPYSPKTGPQRSKGSKGLVTGLIALLLLIAGAIVVLLVQSRRPGGLGVEPLVATAAPVQTSSPTAAPGPTEAASARTTTGHPASGPTQTESRPTSPKPRPPAPVPSTDTKPADAGPAFPFPSSLPPLPSNLPPLPSGFPTSLPSFFPPIPGFTPPAQAPPNDAGAEP